MKKAIAYLLVFSLSALAQMPPNHSAQKASLPRGTFLSRENPELVKLIEWAIDRMRTEVSKSDSSSAKNILDHLSWAEDAIRERQLVVKEVKSDNYVVGIADGTQLLLDQNFMTRFFNDPVHHSGILLQEFRHAYDLQQGKPITKFELESTGHWVEARYFQLHKANGAKLSAEALEHVAALEKGRSSKEWRAFVSNIEGKDYDLLDALQKYEFQVLPTLSADQSHLPFKDNILPNAQRALAAAQTFERLSQGNLRALAEKPSEMTKVRQALRTVQTFLDHERLMNAGLRKHIAKPNAAAMQYAQELEGTLKKISDANFNGLSRWQGVPSFQVILGLAKPPLEQPTEVGQSNRDEFARWRAAAK